ncbi:MAG: cytochrome P450 [Actinomycetota bacterium]|nr:cytochrome P450 [Actinomycetota bacterium]
MTIGLVKLLEAGGLARLAGNAEAVGTAVEEMLRHQTGRSGEAMPRWTLTDVDLYGQHIPAGELVLARLEAANHDPTRFPDPDRFDPSRVPNPHLSFGHGPHHCLGAALARIELTAAVSALAERIPTLTLACCPEDIPWSGHPLDDGPAALPVTW